NALANAAQDAARFASVDPRNASCIRTMALRGGGPANLTSSNVTITTPGTVEIGQPVTVSVQSTYQPITPLIADVIGSTNLTMRAGATMQIRAVPGSSLSCTGV